MLKIKMVKIFQNLTGNGPANFKLKKLGYALGWQPYSIAQKMMMVQVGL